MDKQTSNRQRLLWAINFINQDIDSLGTGDFLKVFVEMKEIIRALPVVILGEKKEFPKIRKVPPPYALIQDTPKMRELVKSVQVKVKAVFETIYETSQSCQRTGKKPPTEYLNIFAEDIPYAITVGPDQIYAGPDLGFYSLEYEIGKLIYDGSPSWEGRYHSLKIKKCPAPKRNGICGKFFIQLHQKEKNYCSNQCAWRAYSKWVRDDKKKSREK